MSPLDIEAAIRNLSGVNEQGQLTKILQALEEVDDAADRQRLQTLLDQRVRELTQHTDESDLALRIEMLTIGPEATVDDLRAQDAIVLDIGKISDPIRREQLLKRLEERERETDAGAVQPSASIN